MSTVRVPENTGYVAPVAGENPNATRYVLLPVVGKEGLSGQVCRMSNLSPNEVIALDNFQYPYTGEKGLTYGTRTALDQSLDITTLGATHGAVSFDGLVGEDVEVADQVFEALESDTPCEKYPEIHNCTTCWLDYLRTEADAQIKALPAPYAELAVKTKEQLVNGLNTGQMQARDQFNKAVESINNPKDGKSILTPQERINMKHCHENEPKFNFSTAQDNSAEIGRGIADAIRDGMGGGMSKDDMAEFLADTIAPFQAEIETLKTQLAEKEARTADDEITAPNEDAPSAEAISDVDEVQFSIGDPVMYAGQEYKVLGKPFGRIKIDEDLTVDKSELTLLEA